MGSDVTDELPVDNDHATASNSRLKTIIVSFDYPSNPLGWSDDDEYTVLTTISTNRLGWIEKREENQYQVEVWLPKTRQAYSARTYANRQST